MNECFTLYFLRTFKRGFNEPSNCFLCYSVSHKIEALSIINKRTRVENLKSILHLEYARHLSSPKSVFVKKNSAGGIGRGWVSGSEPLLWIL